MDAAVELGLHRLGHFREGGRAILRFVDVLLHLVQHEHGVRQLAVLGQGEPCGLDELLGRDVGLQRWELLRQQLPRRFAVRREAGIRGNDRVGDDGTDVKVVELAQPVLTGRLHRRANVLEQLLLAQPETEARQGIQRGQAPGAQQNGKHAVTDVIDTAAEQRSRGRHGRPSGPVRVGVQLAKLSLHLVGQPAANQTARGRPVGEWGVHPQVGKHLQEVRLPAAEETADPCGVLLRGPEVREIPVENALQGVAELPVANEGLKLLPQLLASRGIGDVGNPGLAVVGQPRRARVAIEYLVDLHNAVPPPCSVIPWAR